MAWAENIYFDSQGFTLDIARFDFPDQGITCVWGASGSGKSTLLQCMSGLIENPKFKLLISGKLISELPVRDRNIGFVFQDFSLFPHMSVWQNIAFAAEAKGLKPDIWSNHANEMINHLGLAKIINQTAATLSGGEQQRVAIARALVTKPRLVLMDEPLSSLDEKMRDSARLLIVDLCKTYQIPFLIVTHDLRDVRIMSDHMLVLDHGRSIGCGKSFEILDKPECLELARLIPENQIVKLKTHQSRTVIAKKWTFELCDRSAASSDLQAKLINAYDMGASRQGQAQLEDGQIVQFWTKVSIQSLKSGSTVYLKIDESSIILL
jgi:ABC-type sugar transport system ATPase subunit